MNEITKKIGKSALRTILATAAAFVIGKGWLSASTVAEIVAALTPVLMGWWGVNTQVNEHQETLIAAASGPTTVEAVQAARKAGMAPSVSTPSDAVPELTPVATP